MTATRFPTSPRAPVSQRRSPSAAGHRQRGSMALPMLLMLLGLISMLGLIEVGYLYWVKRDTQKVADLAALAGAQRLNTCDNNGNGAARGNAVLDNNFPASPPPAISCGNWTPTNPGDDHFVQGVDPVNAVKVELSRPALPVFGFAYKSASIHATAVATNSEPLAAFSVGSQLLELQNDGLVPGLLKVLGLDVGGTSLVGYNGLANLRITPSGLLKELGIDVSAVTDVGTLNSILAARQVNVTDLINAVAHIGEQQQLAQVTLDALNTLRLQAQAQGGQLVQLGTDSASAHRGLFALIEAANAQSALNAQVSALDLVNVGLEVANSHHFVDLSVPLPGVSAWVAVIEPPSIAIGGVGVTAYTSQIRVGVNVDTDAIPLAGALLKALGTTIKLPLILDVTNGKGRLASLCDSDADGDGETATIATSTSILNMCLGKFDKNVMSSTSQSCDEVLQNEKLVTILGIPVSQGSMHVEALTGQGDLILHQDETGSIHANLNLGDAVSDLMRNVLLTVLGSATTNGAASPNISDMTDKLWSEAGTQADTPSGRKQRMQVIEGMLTKPVSPETTGLLPGLANLVGGLLDSVGDLLGGVLGAVTGDGCSTTLLGLPGGNVNGCKAILNNTLSHTQPAGSSPISNALLAPLAQLLDVLRPALNGIGDQLLKPLLTTLLGEQPGRTDVHLMSLQCHRTQLVY